MLFQWCDSLFEWGKILSTKGFQKIKFIVQQVIALVIILIVVVWASVLSYGCFHYIYMPTVAHQRKLHLRFRTDCDNRADGHLCEFPYANVSLQATKYDELLHRGQKYVVAVEIDLPESPVNQNHGMFLVSAELLTTHGQLITSSKRVSMLRYKSALLETVETLFMLPNLLLGASEQKQTLSLALLEDYQEDSYKPTLHIVVQVHSKHIEIYGMKLNIHATFTGLRYLLYHWPTVSAFVGISSNMLFYSVLLLTVWCNLSCGKTNEVTEDQGKIAGLVADDPHLPVFQSSASRPRGHAVKPAVRPSTRHRKTQSLSHIEALGAQIQTVSAPSEFELLSTTEQEEIVKQQPQKTSTKIRQRTSLSPVHS